MKLAKVLYYVGVVISLLVGTWHFFVPYLYQWYDYIPAQYENLIVGIDYTNYSFSLLLTGLSALLIFFGKRVFSGNRELLILYGFLVFVWLNRVALAIIEPWPMEPIAWAAIGQLIMAIVLFVVQAAAFAFLLIQQRKIMK